jgi:hypothetical protein
LATAVAADVKITLDDGSQEQEQREEYRQNPVND